MKYLVDKENLKLFTMVLVSISIGFFIAYFNLFIGFLISAILSAVVLFMYFSVRDSRVESLSDYLLKLNEGDYSYDIESYEEGELAKLQSQLNKTTVLIQTMNVELMSQKKMLQKSLEDIAHQLKTPISSLLLLNEMQEDDELVLKSKDQLLRMNYLTNSLLKLVKLDGDLEVFEYDDVVLDDLLKDLNKLVQPSLGEIKLDISSSSSVVHIDRQKTLEALFNVVSNKTRYAKSYINIKVVEDSFFTNLLISDDGEHIKVEEREKIFERFYSGDNRGSRSIGIGLSIAKEYMEKQSVKLNVKQDNTFLFQFGKI